MMGPEQEPNIVIREAWGEEKEVGFRGIEHIDMPEEQMRDLIDKYGETLIELDEIDQEYDGLEWCWHVGRVVHDMDDRGEFAKLNRYSDIDIGHDWNIRRYVNFYQLFPEGGYDDRISKSVYLELCITERLEKGKKAYQRLVSYHEGADVVNPSVYEVRAWVNTDNFDVENIVESLKEEAATQTTDLGIEQLHRGVRRVLIMNGDNPGTVEREDVQEAVEQLQEV